MTISEVLLSKHHGYLEQNILYNQLLSIQMIGLLPHADQYEVPFVRTQQTVDINTHTTETICRKLQQQ